MIKVSLSKGEHTISKNPVFFNLQHSFHPSSSPPWYPGQCTFTGLRDIDRLVSRFPLYPFVIAAVVRYQTAHKHSNRITDDFDIYYWVRLLTYSKNRNQTNSYAIEQV